MRTERLEAVAELSASLAHEIKNPLASIRSAVEQLALSAGAGEDERTLGRLIVRESDRLSRLLSEFLDFARVRVTRVWDERRDGRRVFGFEYETLPGHLEIGRMDYEVHESGESDTPTGQTSQPGSTPGTLAH